MAQVDRSLHKGKRKVYQAHVEPGFALQGGELRMTLHQPLTGRRQALRFTRAETRNLLALLTRGAAGILLLTGCTVHVHEHKTPAGYHWQMSPHEQPACSAYRKTYVRPCGKPRRRWPWLNSTRGAD